MRGVLFFTIVALCTLAEEASAVAATGRAGKSSSRRGNTCGASGRTGRPEAPPPRRRRDETVLDSDDGESVSWEEAPAVVIGAVRPEGGREVSRFLVGEGFHVLRSPVAAGETNQRPRDHAHSSSAYAHPGSIMCADSRALYFPWSFSLSEAVYLCISSYDSCLGASGRRVFNPQRSCRRRMCDS